ncbi:hypothetical protein [Methylorubrum populi]|uniref:hypothetical protein n=1 Tax=Methylorubrum populi TaxID=223967 RepID=UPI001263F324|nr:hypothetical protein [Methylorubrum populi]
MLAAIWRGHKAEIKVGEPPIWLIVLMLGYIGLIFSYFYFVGSPSRPSGFYIFMSALGGEAFGAGVTFAILRALFFTRGMAKAEIVAAYLIATVLSVLLVWGTVAFKI